jgi:hypothetical protein
MSNGMENPENFLFLFCLSLPCFGMMQAPSGEHNKKTSANYDQLAQLIVSPAGPEHYAKRQ